MNVGEDRISELPDPLVHHILSFVPIKFAISTSVLSKRWKNVWVSIPDLDFLDMGPPRIVHEGCDEQDIILETNKFMDFVYKLMIQRNTLNIKKFYLDCNGHFDHKRVNAWITTAIKCQVEEFIFSRCFSYLSDDKMIPDSLLTCESLTTLDFGFAYQDGLDLPDSISLPKLRILRLTNIIYDDEELVGKLFSSCPVLEELCLTDCSWGLISYVVRSNMEDIKVEINAPNILSFTYCDCLAEDFVVDSFLSLHDADLYYNYGDIKSRVPQMSKFTTKLYNVKLLKISGAYFKILKLAKDMSTSFPTFDNLNRLVVYKIRYLQMKTLFNFLEFSPNLESLVIKKVESSGKVNKNTLTFNKVPRCLEGFKSFEIQRFNGNPKEMEIVAFVLKHARVLEMVIMETSYLETSYYMRDYKDQRKMRILKLSRLKL
ncbi:hypothetical protein MKX03_025738 [Papaver bracteatum]|nr:hypothetical protein MKX03_025738 [Papaver bracteatum]